MTNAELIAKLQKLPPGATAQSYSPMESDFVEAHCVMYHKVRNVLTILPSTKADMLRSISRSPGAAFCVELL